MTTTTLIPPTSTTGSVNGGVTGLSNYYEFTVSSENIYTFKEIPYFNEGETKGGVNFILQENVNGTWEEKSLSNTGAGQESVINVALDPGNYRVEVKPYFGEVNYTLTTTYHKALNDDRSDYKLSNSYSLGSVDWGSTISTNALPDHQLVSNGTTIIDFNQHKGDLHDAYSFIVDKPTTINVALTPDGRSNVDLALYDVQGKQIIGSFNSTGAIDTVTANLKAGTYWVDASFVNSSNQQSIGESTNFVATYDLSMSGQRYQLPTTVFRPFNGNAIGLAETFNFNNTKQPETITITNAKYSGLTEQSAVINNFAGEVNAGILLTTGNANDLLGHDFNEKKGLSTEVSELVKNWSNDDGRSISMQPLDSKGMADGFNSEVFQAINNLVNDQNKDLSPENQLPPVTAVYDAASLSFDVTVRGKGNFLTFDLLFGSEEYALFANEYVDGAVIMVDGKNYALFDPKDPQSLLSVTQQNVDAKYFYDNTQLDDNTSIYPTEFNGVSRLISVMAPIDTTKTTHHISIAIADTNDHVLDSGIFLTNLESLEINRPVAPPPAYVGRESDLAGLFGNLAGSAKNDNKVGSDVGDLAVLGAGNDQVASGAGDDVVLGDLGNDSMQGGEGNDALSGGVGNDVINGGVGSDVLTGGAGADRFVITSSLDTTIGTGTGDWITDFNAANGDKIDLSGIDANTAISGNQFFAMTSSNTFNTAGQLRYDANQQILYGNTDTDSTSEFSIQLSGVPNLSASAVVL